MSFGKMPEPLALAHRVAWQQIESILSGIYTGEKTLHVVAVASDGDLKRWEDFY